MSVEWDRFRVKLKPAGNHWKSARSRPIRSRSDQDLVRSSQIWQRFLQIRWFFPQIVLGIAGSVVFMPDLIVLVDETCEIKLKSRRKAGEFTRMFMLFWRVGFHEFWRRGLETDPGFWSSGPASDHWSSCIGWKRVGYGWFGWVAGWVGQP